MLKRDAKSLSQLGKDGRTMGRHLETAPQNETWQTLKVLLSPSFSQYEMKILLWDRRIDLAHLTRYASGIQSRLRRRFDQKARLRQS